MEHYREVNRGAWTYLAQAGTSSSHPYGPHHFAHARELLDPHGWIPWEEVTSVLCLGASGGQQAPLFAALDYRVTAVDLCPAQLKRDRAVAETHDLEVECIEGDMLDLAPLYGRGFDLVYQAISACYVPNVRRLYQEVARVLRPGGYYRVEHSNPVHFQLASDDPWDGQTYRIVRPQRPGEPIPWRFPSDDGTTLAVPCWHYIHPPGHLIGGLGDAGLVLLRFAERTTGDAPAEPGSFAHLAAYLPHSSRSSRSSLGLDSASMSETPSGPFVSLSGRCLRLRGEPGESDFCHCSRPAPIETIGGGDGDRC